MPEAVAIETITRPVGTVTEVHTADRTELPLFQDQQSAKSEIKPLT
jgi:hypothetical protein